MNRKKGINAKKSGDEINKQGQINRLDSEISEMYEIEDTTKYGEFVSSYFAWLTLDRQKKKAKEMENMTNK